MSSAESEGDANIEDKVYDEDMRGDGRGDEKLRMNDMKFTLF